MFLGCCLVVFTLSLVERSQVRTDVYKKDLPQLPKKEDGFLSPARTLRVLRDLRAYEPPSREQASAGHAKRLQFLDSAR